MSKTIKGITAEWLVAKPPLGPTIMKTLNIAVAVIAASIMVGTQPQASAAAVPVGTIIVIRTTNNIISNDPPGRQFNGVLANNIVAGDKVVVPVGTAVRGIVKSPHFTIGGTSRPLTLRLTDLIVHGRPIAIKTEELECGSNSPWTIGPDRRVQVTGDAFMYNAGTVIPFHLKQPVEI